jgi:hypothetical protein
MNLKPTSSPALLAHCALSRQLAGRFNNLPCAGPTALWSVWRTFSGLSMPWRQLRGHHAETPYVARAVFDQALAGGLVHLHDKQKIVFALRRHGLELLRGCT